MALTYTFESSEIPSFQSGNTHAPADLDLAEPDQKGKFRLALKKGKLILTYKTHLPKDLFKQWLLQKGKQCKCWVAHENADQSNPYEHSHVLIMYDENIDTANARYFDFNEIHPNIKKIVTKTHLTNVFKYMCKEDKSLESEMMLLAQQHSVSIFDRVSECATVQDALRMAETPNEAMGLLTMFNHRGMRPINVLPPKWDWQVELDNELKDDPNNRNIIWYYDPEGNSGKTQLLKYEMVTYPQDVYAVSQFGGARDAATIIKGAIAGGWNAQAFIVNLVRSAETKSIYEPLEMIKDGFITATKYEGGSVIFPEPHVVVFANFLPEIFAMSLDRWEIRIMDKVKGVPTVVRRMSAYELAKEMEEGKWGNEEELADPNAPWGELMDKLAEGAPKGKGKAKTKK